jgi:hypothetical protein
MKRQVAIMYLGPLPPPENFARNIEVSRKAILPDRKISSPIIQNMLSR